MKIKQYFGFFIKLLLLLILTPFLLLTFQYFSKAAPKKANLKINSRKIVGIIPQNWRALAQGGEEKGVRMLENIIPEISALYPKYIRIDHIYDFYDVVERDEAGNLIFNWDKLDTIVCDIYHAGAKPFFSLGYMPSALSSDGSLISKPKDWNEWSLLVQKTIERYSGQSTRLCGQVTGDWLADIYYEVWNEPDLETFGQWSLYGGEKDYKILYYYSSLGATRAQNVNHFLLGGPVTTAAYKNWFQVFLDYVLENNLRIDFLSWHHYSKNTNDYADDVINFNRWLSDEKYTRFRFLRKIVSEWGYDSNPNPVSETEVGAAHTISAIRNLIEQQLEMAFAFEIKDGLTPRWGILTNQGQKKPRYYALQLLNLLGRSRLSLEGEGTYVQAVASIDINLNKIVVILVNYDQNNKNIELVPVTFLNLNNGRYKVNTTSLKGEKTIDELAVTGNKLQKDVIMLPNSVVALELIPEF